MKTQEISNANRLRVVTHFDENYVKQFAADSLSADYYSWSSKWRGINKRGELANKGFAHRAARHYHGKKACSDALVCSRNVLSAINWSN